MAAAKKPPASKPAGPARSSPARPERAVNTLRPAETRWQRTARYVWDKGGSRGGR
ncbi:MAG: hypothetical protein AW08_01541 [Candidatus Accumulibacter adjunctus]|uniref:Uncharacterized protein n=1 Tax=Candidatus Accumulibacter adjunctus TaxID=1454001 RepID=A0A011MZC7_9PROT|nr:MAG: hypothetical protein AW08_01541 [Candidatus Accumulibacter adjunctus]